MPKTPEQVIAKAKKMLGAKATGKRFGFGSNAIDRDEWEDDGWEFVEPKGKLLKHGGDPLMMRDA